MPPHHKDLKENTSIYEKKHARRKEIRKYTRARQPSLQRGARRQVRAQLIQLFKSCSQSYRL